MDRQNPAQPGDVPRGDAPLALRARWVVPMDRPPLEGGTVIIRAGRIESLEQSPCSQASRDLGDVAILPGLINCHVHLEFSALSRPLGRAGMGMGQWIEEVVRWRRLSGEPTRPEALQQWQDAVQQGLLECLAAGVTSIAENATRGWPADWAPSAPVGGVLFRELLGPTATRAADQQQVARHWLAAHNSRADLRFTRGLAPHAPYTVHWELLEKACQLARVTGCPLSMHVAESPEELELLGSGSGALCECLQRLEAWEPSPAARRTSPLEYLKLLSQTPRCLVVHGNYLQPMEWQLLADRRERMAVVHCPRTHQYFQHPPFPWIQLQRAGVRVVLGTDGRSSSPDLDLWADLRAAARLHPGLRPAQLLAAATVDAAAALGCGSEIGSLTPGKRADLNVVQLPEPGGFDPCASLLESDGPVVETYRNGRQLFPFKAGSC